MKLALLMLCLFKSLTSLCQTSYLIGRVTEGATNEGFAGVTVLLKQGDTTVSGATTDGSGEFRIEKVAVGNYTIQTEKVGYRTEMIETVAVTENNSKLIIPFPGPCKFIYTKSTKPNCIGGHTDKIIPIAYGLPGNVLMKKAKRGKVYLGGCRVSGCDPKYYCTIHKVEL